MDRDPRVLLVDDDENFREVTRTELSDQGFEVKTARTTDRAKKYLEDTFYPVVLLDLMLEDEHGGEFVRVIQDMSPGTEIIVLTGNATVESAVELLKSGIYDYKTKPCPLDELEAAIRNAYERVHLRRDNEALRKALAHAGDTPRLVGSSEAMERIRTQVKEVANESVPVLVTGESGTGKEVVSRLIHETSDCADQPFVPVDAGTIPWDLFEAELFGYQEGAFTGAEQDTEGLVASADGGTLFFDEIGEVPMDLQSKLLRFLETREYRRVGDTRLREADVRVISATNRSLETMVEEGSFREELYFRLNVFPVNIPPLRERREDLDELVPYLMEQSEVRRAEPIDVTQGAMRALKDYDWPGNVRELKNVIDRLLITADQTVEATDVNRFLDVNRPTDSDGILPLSEMEARQIERALNYYQDDKPAASEALGISLKTLYNKIGEYEIGVD
ncbi:MAG: sigma-54-dependent transcriptional regulator [bacterium]